MVNSKHILTGRLIILKQFIISRCFCDIHQCDRKYPPSIFKHIYLSMSSLLFVIYLISAAIFIQKADATNFRTFCLKNQKSCDSSWEPLPNLRSALVGYDLPTGNPYASNFIEDPGLKKQIFNATVHSGLDGGSYRLESGVSAREYPMCDDSFTTRVATTIQGYKKIALDTSTAGYGFDLGIEAESSPNIEDEGISSYEGRLPSLIKIFWNVNDDTKRFREFFRESKGALAISEAQCITHKVDVSQFVTPGFTPEFIEVLRILETQDTEVKQKRSFRRFVRDYGTHYLSSTYLGSKIATVNQFTSYERLKHGRKKISQCASKQATKVFEIKEQSSTKESSETNQCYSKQDQDELKNDRIKTVAFGTKPDPNKELKQWKSKKQLRPIPVKFELTPIVNLFTEENLNERYNVSSVAILEWFLPLYLKYCKVLNYDCTTPTGCGSNDQCNFDENCVRDRLASGGYRCQASSWADVPNWPLMSGGKNDLEHDRENNKKDKDTISRSDNIGAIHYVDTPESANVTWFRAVDYDRSGALSYEELVTHHGIHNWYNTRYGIAIEKLIQEADRNGDRVMDMSEYIRLHEKHPWYSEQLTFLLVNTDNNGYLTKDEFFEAAKVSPDMQALNFSYKQLENLVDGLIAIGDQDGDHRISFEEYVSMSNDVFVDNFAPDSLKRILRQ